jgi:pimeloyl-ACP methyl ester carboxylesterase
VWDRVVPLLVPHATVVRVDLPGYGHSPDPAGECTPAAHVAALRRALLHHGIDPPVTVVGLSMGANLALTYAERFPAEVAALVAVGLPYYPTPAAARAGLATDTWARLALGHPRLAPVVLPSLWWLGRHAGPLASRVSGPYTRAMTEDALRVRYPAYRSSLGHCLRDFRADGPLAASADLPRTVVHGSLDGWAPASAVRDAVAPFARTRFELVEGGPHNLAVAAPERVAAAVLGVLPGA